MNNDIYAEWLVKRKPAPYAIPLKLLMIVFLVSSFLFIMLVPSIGCLLFLIASAVAYFGFRWLDVEYEYIFVTSELSIDRILGQQKRKRMIVIDVNQMEIMAPMEAHELEGFKNNPNVKKVDFSSRKADAKTYGIYYPGEDGKKLYIIEPNDQVIKAIRGVVPRKIIL